MKRSRSIIVLLLVICMCFSLIPVEVFAEETADVVQEELQIEKTEAGEEIVSEEQEKQPVVFREGDVKEDTIEQTADSEADGDPGAWRLSGKDIPAEFYGPMSKVRAIQHDSRFDGYTIQKGIDVSKWNGNIDWNKVKAAGIKFAFIRVAYRTYGTGALNVDPTAVQNLKGAIAAGVPVGVYIFSQAITTTEAREEADYILKYISEYDITLPVVLDYEYTGGADGRLYKAKHSKQLDNRKMTDICLAFCKRVEAAGYTPMVYANKSMLKDDLYAKEISASYPVWLAHYISKTDYTGDYNYWQYTPEGKVDGITGDVDMNYRYVKDEDRVSGLTASEKTTNSITLKWDAFKDASGYAVYKKDSSGNYIEIDIVEGLTTYTDSSLEKGTAYTYKVRSFKDIDGERVYDDKYSDAVTGITMLDRTTLSGTATAFDTIKLSWGKVSGVSGYQVQRYDTSKQAYTTIKTITGGSTVTYSNGYLNSSTVYKYRIRAYKNVGSSKAYSSYSSGVSVKTKGSVIGQATGTSVNVRSGPGTSYKSLKKVTKGTKLTITGSRSGWYRISITISGVKKTGYISKDYVKLVTTSTSTSVGKASVTATGTAFDKVKLTWKKVSGATGYQLQRYNSSKKAYETIKTITSGSTITYTNGSLNCSTTYKYRIRAFKKSASKTTYGAYSTAVSAKTKAAVKGKTTATNINVRSGPGTTYKSLKKVGKNVTLTITGSRSDWYRISITISGKKKTAYIVKKCVKLI